MKIVKQLPQKTIEDLSDSIWGRVFALHTTDPGLIPAPHMVLQALPGVIPEQKDRVSPEHCQVCTSNPPHKRNLRGINVKY